MKLWLVTPFQPATQISSTLYMQTFHDTSISSWMTIADIEFALASGLKGAFSIESCSMVAASKPRIYRNAKRLNAGELAWAYKIVNKVIGLDLWCLKNLLDKTVCHTAHSFIIGHSNDIVFTDTHQQEKNILHFLNFSGPVMIWHFPVRPQKACHAAKIQEPQ